MSVSPATERRSAGSISMAVAVAAFLVAVLAVVITSDDPPTTRVDASSAGGLSPTIELTLSEFAIKPASVTAAPGRVVLRVQNKGSVAHNVSVEELGKKTVDLQPGTTAELDLGEVAAGHYTILCEIPGHADSGMTGMLMVGSTSMADGAAGHRRLVERQRRPGRDGQRPDGEGHDRGREDLPGLRREVRVR